MANYYYYILCAIPKLRFGERNRPNVKSFLETRGHLIFKEEWEQIKLILLKYDCLNLYAVLSKQKNIHPLGTLSIEKLEETIKKGEGLPEFILSFITLFKSNEIERADPLDHLLQDYYSYATEQSVPFLREWLSFERDLHNIVAGLRAKKLNLEPEKFILNHNETAQLILSNFSSPDFDLAKRYLWLSELMLIMDSDDPIVVERKLDEIKWNKLEEMTHYIYFRSEALLSYFIKLNLLERWLQVLPEKADEILNSTLSDLKSKEVESSDKENRENNPH